MKSHKNKLYLSLTCHLLLLPCQSIKPCCPPHNSASCSMHNSIESFCLFFFFTVEILIIIPPNTVQTLIHRPYNTLDT